MAVKRLAFIKQPTLMEIYNSRSNWRLLLFLLVIMLTLLACSGAEQLPPGKKIPDLKPSLLLISFDGFRWDFLDRGITPNLDRLVQTGVRSKSLIPAFPSKTFPNHYSIVTGLYPAHHGIIANKMYDPQLNLHFNSGSSDKDGRWWGGEPIWATAVKQGQASATFFWPGSEAEIGGVRPTYWVPFNKGIKYLDRLKQLMDWLELPVDRRPTVITLYLEETDKSGHDYGPNSPQVTNSIKVLDQTIGQLINGLTSRGIFDQLNIIIVSDHGMSELSVDKTIFIDKYIDPEKINIIEDSPLLWIWPSTDKIKETYDRLKNADPHLKVYYREELPKEYHMADNPRISPIIAIADEGWSIGYQGVVNSIKRRYILGSHGQDPQLPAMQGIFIAHGPAFKSGLVINSFPNINLYNLMAHILKLQPAPNDGCMDCLNEVLKEP